MKHFIINMVAILILAISCPGRMLGDAATVREDRVWVYEQLSDLVGNRYGLDCHCYPFGMRWLTFMKFEEPVAYNGKDYFPFVAFRSMAFSMPKMSSDGDNIISDYSKVQLIAEGPTSYTMCYLTEDNGKVYQLALDDNPVTEFNPDETGYKDVLIYDWTLADGDYWLNTPFTQPWKDWFDMESLGSDDDWFPKDNFKVEKMESRIIDGEECAVYRLNGFLPERFDFEFVECVGPLTQGWLADVMPWYPSGFRYNVKDLAILYNAENEKIFANGYFQGTKDPNEYKVAIFLTGEMNDWTNPDAWEATPTDKPGEYRFSCTDGQTIKAGQRFRINNASKSMYNLGNPNGTPIKLDEETEVQNSEAAQDLVLDSDWSGTVYINIGDNPSVRFTAQHGAVDAVSVKNTDTDTRIYDLMGRELREAQPGTVYIQGGKKYVAR